MQLNSRLLCLILLLGGGLMLTHPKRVATKIMKAKAPYTSDILADKAVGFFKQDALRVNRKKTSAEEER